MQVGPREPVGRTGLGVVRPVRGRVPGNARVAGEEVAAHRTLVDDLELASVELDHGGVQGGTATGVELARVVEDNEITGRLVLAEQLRQIRQHHVVDPQALLDAGDLVGGLVDVSAQHRRDVVRDLLQGRVGLIKDRRDLVDLWLDLLQRADVDRPVLEHGRSVASGAGHPAVELVRHLGRVEDLLRRVHELARTGEVRVHVGHDAQCRDRKGRDCALHGGGVGACAVDGGLCGRGVPGCDLCLHVRQRCVRLLGVPSGERQAHDQPYGHEPHHEQHPRQWPPPQGPGAAGFSHDAPCSPLITTTTDASRRFPWFR